MNLGSVIMNKRKQMGYTQQALADRLHVSFQAVSKWENGTNYPDVDLLPAIASVLGTSVDALLGYRPAGNADYENRYRTEGFYWGLAPNNLCYEVMKLRPPVKPLKVLDVGCGEGKDAVFLARNGYIVTAFDVTEAGVEKGKALAERCGTYVDFFQADVADHRLSDHYDIILSSGVFHFIRPEDRADIVEDLKSHTNENGLHAINVFVEKPFLAVPPGKKNGVDRFRWKSGELFVHYHDWMLHKVEEVTFDCNSGGVPHRHCMDVMIAEKVQGGIRS